MRRSHSSAALLLTGVMLVAASASAGPYITGTLVGEFRHPDSTRVLYQALRDSSLASVPPHFFGERFDPDLADLIVFIDTDDSVRVGLTRGGKDKRELWGARYLWVMVFKAGQARRPMPKQKLGDSVGVVVEPLDYQLGWAESGFMTAVGRIISVSPRAPGAVAVADTTCGERLWKIGWFEDGLTTDLYFTMVKVPLKENVRYRVVTKVKHSRAYATFGNHDASLLSASIGGGLTFGMVSAGDIDLADSAADPFLFLHLYPLWGRPNFPKGNLSSPFGEGSCSLVLGIGLGKKDSWERGFVGVGFGHLVGSLGIATGAHFRKDDRARLALSITYAL